LALFRSKMDDSARSVRRILKKSSNFYEETIILSSNADISSNFVNAEEFRNERYQKIIEGSLIRDQRIKQAKMLKDRFEIETKKKIHDNINRKSKGYKDALARIKAENIEFNKKLKQIFVALNCELILNFLNSLAQEGKSNNKR